MRSTKTIWVVDDDEDIIFCFTEALAAHMDYRIVYAANAKEVRAEDGDIVFLDLTGTNSGALLLKPGVHLFRMTGGFKPAELHKPFSAAEIEKLMASIDNMKKSLSKAS